MIFFRSSPDDRPPYGFMLLPGTTCSGSAMKRSSFSSSQTKSASFIALENSVVGQRACFPPNNLVKIGAQPIVALPRHVAGAT